MPNLNDYASVVGTETLDELHYLADKLKGRSLLHVNSTAVGGGVAEILNRMVPLFIELGINTEWHVVKGGEAFHSVTKKIHNALHGTPQNLTLADFDAFVSTQEDNLKTMKLDYDTIFIHDPHFY